VYGLQAEGEHAITVDAENNTSTADLLTYDAMKALFKSSESTLCQMNDISVLNEDGTSPSTDLST